MRNRGPFAALFIVPLLGVLSMLSGCAGYRLGSTLPPGVKSVHVAAFVNRSGEPQLEIETTRAAIQEFQRDGTLRVVAAGPADVDLKATVTRFVLEPIRYEDDQAKTTSEYRIRITARIVLTNKATGAEMLEKWVEGETTFEPGADLASAKVTAIPAAATDLAHDIVESVVEYW